MNVGTLTPSQWAVVACLYEHKGWMDSATLNRRTAAASQMYDHAKPRKPRTIYLHIFGIREKLGDGAILCRPGVGYCLGAPGVKAYRAHKAAEEAFAAQAAVA